MKKFISMVMAAAMVVSLVPATAFAANTATFKVVNDQEYTEDAAKKVKKDNDGNKVIAGPQLQLKLKDVDTATDKQDDWEITLDFENAEFLNKVSNTPRYDQGNKAVMVTVKDGGDAEDDSVTLKLKERSLDAKHQLEEDDVIILDLEDFGLQLTKTSKGTEATVEVSGDFGDSDALVFASVLDYGLDVTLKKVADVAEEETTNLEKNLKIEATVGSFAEGQTIELKLNSGFEWDLKDGRLAKLEATDGIKADSVKVNENELTFKVDGTPDTIEIAKDALGIEAVSAKEGAVAKITVKAKDNVDDAFKATAEAVEAAKVVGDTVTLSVDEDEDVPVIYSGVNVNNDGITDDSDHKSLEVTLEESVAEALDVKKSFTMTLPEGVYVTDVDVETETQGNEADDAEAIEGYFEAAYKKGEQECFEFARKTFTDSEKAFEWNITFTLIAEPTFEGDVTLTLGGDAFDKEQEVVIAKFVAPYTVEAAQNDLIIDYRNTAVPTNIVVKEAEAGLWAEGLEFKFGIEKMTFEDDATITVNEDDSDMEIKELKNQKMGFKVTEESDDAAAVVTISDISLYMERNIPAGAYDLELLTSAGIAMMTTDPLFTTDEVSDHADYYAADFRDWDSYTVKVDAEDKTEGDQTTDVAKVEKVYFVAEADTVKEGFVNVITAGRDQDDASFTKKVVVPVGESYIIAGEETVTLDVPAYVSASGYTMLPVRAVAVALGINNNSVLWDQATKTVTILYGQRIITMVAGQKVVYVNGSAIPASASVEIVNGRTFLPMRDLATALGVTDITWDAATKTATLNGNK